MLTPLFEHYLAKINYMMCVGVECEYLAMHVYTRLVLFACYDVLQRALMWVLTDKIHTVHHLKHAYSMLCQIQGILTLACNYTIQ